MRPCSRLVEQNGSIYTSVWFSVWKFKLVITMATCKTWVKWISEPIRSAFAAAVTHVSFFCVADVCESLRFFWKVHANFAQEYPQPLSCSSSHTHFSPSPPQRHKSTIRRVPTQSALLFSPATPLRPASCKSSTANWQVRGTQQPRYSTSPKTLD